MLPGFILAVYTQASFTPGTPGECNRTLERQGLKFLKGPFGENFENIADLQAHDL